MAILDPKGQPFILTLDCLAKLIILLTPTTHRDTDSGEGGGGHFQSTVREKQYALLSPLWTHHNYLTFPGIHSICHPNLNPSLTKSSPLHL